MQGYMAKTPTFSGLQKTKPHGAGETEVQEKPMCPMCIRSLAMTLAGALTPQSGSYIEGACSARRRN